MPARCHRTLLLLPFVILFSWLLTTGHAGAHAFLESSDPASGAIVPTAPAEARLRFTEPLEPNAASASLVDHEGQTIDGITFSIGEPNELIVSLPTGLANGTYSIVWGNISSADGHPARGYVPFTIGTAADIQIAAVPTSVADDDGAPTWLRAGSRWLAFAGLLLILAIWPVWCLAVAPALRRTPGTLRPGLRLISRLTVGGFTLALIGNLAALLVQAMELGGAYPAALRTTLFDTRFGELWMLRIVLLGALAVLLAFVNWVRPARQRLLSTLALIASFALVVPFSLNAHASAQPSGRAFALASDMVHLVAAGVWGGGVTIIAALIWRLRPARPEGGLRRLLAGMLPRFSFLAIGAWILLLLTGAYAGWLQVGNLDAARATSYGNAFLIKLALAAALLAFGATHFAVVSRRIASAAGGERWSRRFLITMAAEAVGIVAILLVTGWLTAEPPARDAVAQAPEGVTISLDANDTTATLLITPATAGPNHLRLALDAVNVPPDAEAVLRLTSANDTFGTREMTLAAVGGNAWEGHGSEFSLAGDWTIEAIVRKVGEYQWQATSSVTIGEPEAATALPGQPWRFSGNAIVGVGMLVIGAMAAAWTVTTTRSRSRKESAGIAVAGLLIGLLFVVQARIDEPASLAAVIADDATIQRGADIYATQCLACHGVAGQGNGPQADGLPVPPADFTDPIHQLHSDESYAAMIINGFPESGMPAFGVILNEQQIADVVTYIRSLGAGLIDIEVPEAAACTIEPRDPAALISGEPGPGATGVDLGPQPIEWPQGEPANSLQSEAITDTVLQYVACTNAGDYGRLLATYTTGYLSPEFATLDEAGRQSALARAAEPQPLEAGFEIGLQAVEEVRMLADGRLAARVVTVDPVNHPHTVDVILVFAEENGRWRIDDIFRPPSADPATPEAVTWPLTTTVDGFTVELLISEGDPDARPVRITMLDSTGESIDGAEVTAIIAPLGAGRPVELTMQNVDPGIYFANAPLPATGTMVAEIEAVLPDGSTLTAGFKFPVS